MPPTTFSSLISPFKNLFNNNQTSSSLRSSINAPATNLFANPFNQAPITLQPKTSSQPITPTQPVSQPNVGKGPGFLLPGQTAQPTAPATQPVAQPTAPTVEQVTPQPTAPVAPPVTQPDQAQGVATGNPQLDALINNLPQIQKALGIGVETPEQQKAREQQQESLNRLIELQTQLSETGAPSDTLTDLDRVIQEQTQALRATSPEELFRTTPQFQAEGITTGQLQREAASRRAPIAQALSDLLTSRSIFGEAQQRQQEFIQSQIQAQQGVFQTQQAFQALQPQTGIAPELQSGILQGIVGQAFQDPLDAQLKQAQIANINSQIAERGVSGLSNVDLSNISPEMEKPVLSSIVNSFADAGSRTGSSGAIATFKNAQQLIGLLDQGVSTGVLSRGVKGLGRLVGITDQTAEEFNAATTLFTANFIKALSGAQVSDKEREFLLGALPSESKQETSNRAGIKEILGFIRNEYETRMNIDFDNFPTEIPNPFSTKQVDDYLSQLGL